MKWIGNLFQINMSKLSDSQRERVEKVRKHFILIQAIF